METEVEKCLHYFDLVYIATHQEELPKLMLAEGAFVAGGKLARNQIKTELKAASDLATKTLEEATKEAEKVQAKLNAVMARKAIKEAEAKAAKEAARKAWIRVATKKAKAEALEKSVQVLTKEVAELAAKAAAKETAKVAAEGSAKTAAKKVPLVGLVAGGIFGLVRVGSAVYNFVQGNKARGIEELFKAPLEVASGAASIVPGPGTAASIGIDAALLAWDIADVKHDLHTASVAEQPDSPEKILLKYKVIEIHDAIEENTYSIEKFMDDVFKITFNKIHCNTDEVSAAKDAAYIYAMVKDIFDDACFAGKFSTKHIAQEMAEKGFSKCQIDIFLAMARGEERK